MKYYFKLFFLICCLFCSSPVKGEKPKVLVTVAPYKGIIEHIAGDFVDLLVLVPKGGDPHTYEPTPSHAYLVSQTDIWFRVGEPSEELLMQTDYPKSKKVIYLGDEQKIDGHSHHHHHSHHDEDPHIWMSFSKLKPQIKAITQELKILIPEESETVVKNCETLLHQMRRWDAELDLKFEAHENKAIFVLHPSLGLFCKDYKLRQVAFEHEGKELTPRRAAYLTQMVQKEKATHLFVQKEFVTKNERILAKTLNLKLVEINPLSENYPQALYSIGKDILKSFDD